MHAHLHDWLHLLIRWSHLIAGIMWIGTSFYFVWLDSAFAPLKEPVKGVDGELYMVHGGFFYRVEKRRFGAGQMPDGLHWFKWEATFTWLTGFALLWVVFYSTNGAYLVDPAVRPLEPLTATGIGLASLVFGWLAYDGLFRSPLARTKLINPVAVLLLAGYIWLLTHTFSGRGAFIHVGAMLGTMMILNVWVHILPNQKKIIEAALAGKEPDYSLGLKAKRRSMHNSYMTLPVLFIMISNHFGATYGHPLNWLVLILFIVLGALIRHIMITMKMWPVAPAIATLGLLVWMTGNQEMGKMLSLERPDAASATLHAKSPEFERARAIIASRCVQCHSAHPTDDVFKIAPSGVMYDTAAQIVQMASRIRERAVIQKTMPLANKTGMTDTERAELARWIEQSELAK